MPDSSLLDTQRLFMHAIRDTGGADAFLASLDGTAIRREAGLAAYRRNALLNAHKALATAYPVLAQVVGDEFLRALARDYWQATPSRSGDLNDYGAGLAHSLATPAEQVGMPWLVDLARLEWAVHEAGMAADHAPLALDALQAYSPEHIPTLHIDLQPAACLIASAWPIASLWQQHQPDHTGEFDLDTRGAEIALVLRQDWRVEVLALGAAEAAFWQAAQAGLPLAEMIGQALQHGPHFDPAHSLREGFARGLIVSLS